MLMPLFQYHFFAIEGISPERFLNIANRRKLRLFNIQRVGGTMYAFIRSKDFPSLSGAAQKAGVRLRVVRSVGLPLIFKRYARRVGFLAGFGIFCLTLWYLSLFVWNVELTDVPPEYAVSASDAVREAGLRTGTLISRVDGATLERELQERLPAFDVITVTRMGSKAQVSFHPSVKRQATVADGIPCDLIASESGEIVQVIAEQGTPLVKAGDIVCAGDTLVSGLFEGQEGTVSLVTSRGSVTAMVEESFSECADFRYTVKEPTGRVVIIQRLTVFGWEIPLFYETPQGNFRRTAEEHSLRVLGVELPVVLRREEWQELCYSEQERGRDACVAHAEARLSRRIQAAEYLSVIDSIRTVSETPTGIRVTRHVTFLREIAAPQKILYSD